MGNFSDKANNPQVIILGPPYSGKTSLLYSQLLDPGKAGEIQFSETQGFQYEEVAFKGDEKNKQKEVICGFWDVGAVEAMPFV